MRPEAANAAPVLPAWLGGILVCCFSFAVSFAPAHRPRRCKQHPCTQFYGPRGDGTLTLNRQPELLTRLWEPGPHKNGRALPGGQAEPLRFAKFSLAAEGARRTRSPPAFGRMGRPPEWCTWWAAWTRWRRPSGEVAAVARGTRASCAHGTRHAAGVCRGDADLGAAGRQAAEGLGLERRLTIGLGSVQGWPCVPAHQVPTPLGSLSCSGTVGAQRPCWCRSWCSSVS